MTLIFLTGGCKH